jgi:tetratricopeptide (TPR) repeat protein
MGRLDKAMADLNAALKILPKQAESLYVRGQVKRRNGDLAGANNDILAAKAQQPRIAEAYAAYGVE